VYAVVTNTETSHVDYGEIITFYSFKGGTGRSMALANVACILAKQNPKKNILIVDWDLEAPGLHRFFFQHKFYPSYSNMQAENFFKDLNNSKGLIDLFLKLKEAINALKKRYDGSDGKTDYEIATESLGGIEIEDFIVQTHLQNLRLLKAGQFDQDYTEYYKNVNAFNWVELYADSPLLIPLISDRLAGSYSYVLIDSRTGFTDTSDTSEYGYKYQQR
jgi:eukaryotic-like serine/threonine-protein kinase